MNKELIDRYNNIAKYYNSNNNIHVHYKGYYDFLILKNYLSLFEKYLFVETFENNVDHWYIDKHNFFLVDKITSKIYIQKVGFKLSSYQIEFSEFINKYGYNFYQKYQEILKKVKYPYLKRLIMIHIDNCSFCNNPEKAETFIIENIYTRYGYQYCKFCKNFAKYSFMKFRIKKALYKFKLYTKVAGKFLKLYYNLN